jgi:hypothetical protein
VLNADRAEFDLHAVVFDAKEARRARCKRSDIDPERCGGPNLRDATVGRMYFRAIFEPVSAGRSGAAAAAISGISKPS